MASNGPLPEGENLRRAVRWLSEEKAYTPEGIQEASIRFDLSPQEEQFLLDHFLPVEDD